MPSCGRTARCRTWALWRVNPAGRMRSIMLARWSANPLLPWFPLSQPMPSCGRTARCKTWAPWEEILAIAYDINDRGQVVGFSTNAAGIGRAFLWENDVMKDLNGLIPTDSGWVLVEARAINKRGQIVGYGRINGQAHAFLLTPHLPVLIVPGIAGTYSDNTDFEPGLRLADPPRRASGRACRSIRWGGFTMT